LNILDLVIDTIQGAAKMTEMASGRLQSR